MSNVIHFPLTLEFLELMASAHAPPGGAVLWRHEKDLRLVRHEGEPLTVEYASNLVINRPEASVVPSLPRTVEAVYATDSLKHLPHLTPLQCSQAVNKAIREDCIDSASRSRKKHTNSKHR